MAMEIPITASNLDTSSKLIKDTFLPLEDDIKTLVTGKQIEEHEIKKDSLKMGVQFSAPKSDALCQVSALGQNRKNIK